MITVKCRFPQTICASNYATDNAVVGNILITNSTTQEMSDISVIVNCNPEVFDFPVLNVKEIPFSDSIELNTEIPLSSQYYKLESDIHVELTVSVLCVDNLIHVSHETIHVFPYNYWDGTAFDQLASFIFKDDTTLSPILRRVEYYMRQFSGNDKMSGYLYDIPMRPRYTLEAISNSIAECSLDKVPDYNLIAPQYILPPDEIMRRRKCNELEMALFISSCLFVAKLNPIICLAQKDILVGCWLSRRKLAEPILNEKEEINEFVETCNDDIAWLHLNSVFSDCDYDISYGLVFADKYLQRHLNEIKTIIDIRAVRSNGVYTVKRSAEHPINLPDYQESTISLTDQAKVDEALVINKYFKERRKNISAIRSDRIYIEILNELYSRWCVDTHSNIDPLIAKYLSGFNFHSEILTAEETNALYQMRNKVILRIINHIASPQIKYGKFVRELIEVKERDSVLIINDDTGGLMTMMNGYCKKIVLFTESLQTNMVYSVWKAFNQFDKLTVTNKHSVLKMDCYNKVFFVVNRNAGFDFLHEVLESALSPLNSNEVIISFSETIFSKLWKSTNDIINLLDKYIGYISDIYYIPEGIAEVNEARFLMRINFSSTNYMNNNHIEMTDASLIPRTSFLDSFAMVKKDEKKSKCKIITQQIHVKSPDWAKKISEDKNPYDPRTWTIKYDRYCYINDFLSILSSYKEEHSFINNNFISVDTLLSKCKKVDDYYYYESLNCKSESISEYDNIGSRYYRISKPVIILYPLGTNAYVWESLDRLASDNHKLNYKMIIINDIPETDPLILKDDGNILIFEPKQSKDLVAICKFMRADIFFAKQLDIYIKFYTTKQVVNFLHRIVVPSTFPDYQEQDRKSTVKPDIEELIDYYRQRPGEEALSISKMKKNVLKVAVDLGFANNELNITYITGLADLLVRLEYVKPVNGWEFISKRWKEQSNHSRKDLIEEMYYNKLKWDKFDKVFLNKKGKPITRINLRNSFYQNNRIEHAAGNIILEVIGRY